MKEGNMSLDEALRLLYPGREEWTDAEVAAAGRVVSWRSGVLPERASRAEVLPTRFVPVGGRVVLGGVEYECVEAEAGSCPAAACCGCDFSRRGRGCWSLQCSPQDRCDGRFVWFVEVAP